MKITNNILVAALAGIALTVFTVLARAEVKGGEKLLQLNGSSAAATVSSSDYKPMSCAKCVDTTANVRDTTAKGASTLVTDGAPAKACVSHGCNSCATTTTTVGAGKHATAAITHTCGSCGSASTACCSPTKGTEAATKGMGNN
jgi:hypothetical protein